ncbi:hypothetical protein Fot_31704 [Forsythia ovata]|uniref:Uncharacterized protein n=1 Tax=Forsythia ovata TaxID=205694 RepID=A0ABD1T5S7_9LAMI
MSRVVEGDGRGRWHWRIKALENVNQRGHVIGHKKLDKLLNSPLAATKLSNFPLETAEVEGISETKEFNRVFKVNIIEVAVEVTGNQGSDDQVCSYECPNCAPDQWNVLNTMERVGPSRLSEKFSNGTSTMDIDDEHFDDLDLDDEADNHMPNVSTILVRLMLSSVMILQKG